MKQRYLIIKFFIKKIINISKRLLIKIEKKYLVQKNENESLDGKLKNEQI
jgi:hypothetical protein